MRYAYALTGAMLVGGAAATVVLQQPLGAQVAQNAPSQMAASAPRGAPMSFADLAAKLQPAVVNISTTQKVQVPQQQNPFAGTPFGDFFRRFGGQGDDNGGGNGGGSNGGGSGGTPATRDAVSLGSGFIISADGYIVTNNHVISGIPTEQGKVTVTSITVTLPDRKEYKATVVGKDATSDLAVLKIDAQNLPFVQFGDSTHTRVGDWVIAIGNPFALGGTVTAGIVSAIHRSITAGPYDRYIQTDAAINQGNSGGPMFDLNGNVVGINTAIYSPSGGNVGIGFAIPAEQAKPVVLQLMKGQKIRRGYLGVAIQPMDESIAAALKLPKDRGQLVARVESGQPAAKAGIQQGDVITRVNNVEITPDNTLSYIVAGLPVGAHVPIDLIRNGKPMTFTAVLTERPSEDKIASAEDGDDDNGPTTPEGQSAPASVRSALGISLQTLTPAIAQQLGVTTARGVVVTSVDPSSDAASKGLQQKDIILAIAQRPVSNGADAAAAVDAAKRAGFKTILLLVQRGNRPAIYLGVDLVAGK
ncbi:Do family serine endopeptidase [Sphingomonas nostoxanthinifaciens]|uniref:Do family serine endopeptidase n=1 Tax=Sphingomonas nostoxanthinifaciens TaxID=2872652 RepID=UPI001CC21E96|nr:Do family serine endopeptidase [Sphingomonas nostoxanthinifaciens]UAK23984.1 Do family serine endopeptidase [Sphingomonas nostoxanthinifaciens]